MTSPEAIQQHNDFKRIALILSGLGLFAAGWIMGVISAMEPITK